MPVRRQTLASEAGLRFESVSATPHGEGWSVLHVAEMARRVLPGRGEVHWSHAGEELFFDPLTSFHLAPGEGYRLQHRAPREHVVLCDAGGSALRQPSRASLLRPRELFGIKHALAQLRRGELGAAAAGAAVAAALQDARALAQDGDSAGARAREHLARHCDERLTIAELAEEARSSPFHLIRQFRRQFGVTPHQYRLHLRLAHAMRRMEEGAANLSDLAFELGFSSQSHFGAVFQRAVGCTPAQARCALR
jgi:AraC-like DNA-binding protein